MTQKNPPSLPHANKYAREFARVLCDHGFTARTGFHLERNRDGSLRYPALSVEPHKGPFYLRQCGIDVATIDVTPPFHRARVFDYWVRPSDHERVRQVATGE